MDKQLLDQYRNNPRFHAITDALVAHAHHADITATELLGAVTVAVEILRKERAEAEHWNLENGSKISFAETGETYKGHAATDQRPMATCPNCSDKYPMGAYYTDEAGVERCAYCKRATYVPAAERQCPNCGQHTEAGGFHVCPDGTTGAAVERRGTNPAQNAELNESQLKPRDRQ